MWGLDGLEAGLEADGRREAEVPTAATGAGGLNGLLSLIAFAAVFPF
jgi:hypothetical protein